MSSTTLKKAKKTKAKQSLAEVDAAPALTGHKPKLAKAKESVHNIKSKKLVKSERSKPAEQPRVTDSEELRPDKVADTRKHAVRTTRLGRKSRGPWKASSPSPPPGPIPPSPTSDGLEPLHSEEEESDAPQEEGSPGEENVNLFGFSTDEDSSDDDLDVDEAADFDVVSLPTVARDDATVRRKLEKAKRKPVRIPYLLRRTAYHDHPTDIRNGRDLSRPHSPRFLRGSDARIFFPIW